MAVKKTTKKKEESAKPAKAKDTATKKPTKKAAAPKAEPVAASTTPTPAAESAPAPKKAAAKKAAAKKAAPAIKLSASQGDLLKKIGGTAEAGYLMEKKAELRSIESLLDKKLIKKGAKDKASGKIRYHISSAGKKHSS